MKRILIGLAFWASFCISASAQEEQFQGWIYFDDVAPSPHYQVITEQSAMDKFRKRIPENRPTKRHPAPPNDDPLRTRQIDFEQQSLIVVTRDETLSAYPEFKDKTESEAVTVIRFSLPQPPPEARPYGWGTYRALLVPSGKNYRVEFVE